MVKHRSESGHISATDSSELCTLEESDEDVEWCADVLRRSPRQKEGPSADQSGRAGLCWVVQAGRQPVELRQVNVGEPDQRPVTGCQVVSNASVMG